MSKQEKVWIKDENFRSLVTLLWFNIRVYEAFYDLMNNLNEDYQAKKFMAHFT